MNVKALKARMILQDKTVNQLCAALGICRSTWQRKISGENEFTQSEIAKLRFELDLDEGQTVDIFFNQQVS